MLAAAAKLTEGEDAWPVYAVISVGGPALLPRPDRHARRRRLQEGRAPSPVRPHQEAMTAAARVISGLQTFVRALPLHVLVVGSVVPLLDASESGVDVCRSPSDWLPGTTGPGSWTQRRLCAAPSALAGGGGEPRHRWNFLKIIGVVVSC